jgi:hypothetical protein
VAIKESEIAPNTQRKEAEKNKGKSTSQKEREQYYPPFPQ